MALKRDTDTRPSVQIRSSDEQEGVEIVRKLLARASVEQSLVQILVVVANIQMGTLKAEVGKGSVRTAIGHGLLGPKA